MLRSIMCIHNIYGLHNIRCVHYVIKATPVFKLFSAQEFKYRETGRDAKKPAVFE